LLSAPTPDARVSYETAINSHSTPAVDAEVRRAQMLAVIRTLDFARVGELSERFGISAVTVRADLDALASRGEVHRVRGGAIPRALLEEDFANGNGDDRASKEKVLIGRAAALLVNDGDSVLMDMGSTTAAFARALAERTELAEVTVFTNGLKTALELEVAAPRITVVLLGGTLRSLRHSLVEPLASVMLEKINVHTVVVGCSGVHPVAGFTNADLPEAEVKKRMLLAGERRVVLADGSKLGRVELARLCAVEDVDVLISGASADAVIADALREQGCDVRLA
jgi:DeoR family transcriptional regulator of aga operon